MKLFSHLCTVIYLDRAYLDIRFSPAFSDSGHSRIYFHNFECWPRNLHHGCFCVKQEGIIDVF